MSVLIINNAEPADRAFNEPLYTAIADMSDVQVIEYRDISSLAHINSTYDAVIVTGVPLHYDATTIRSRLNYFRRLADVDIPLLGVCLGHQNLAALFGANIKYGIEAETGVVNLQALIPDPIFAGLPEKFEVQALHSCSVGVPPDFKLLASSDTCMNQIMKHVYKDIYGFQFHPELSPTGHTLLSNFIAIANK